MPSDFISLLGADLDLNSPKSLYSKESVYDLLPKELQLPSSSESTTAAMSQKSGGEAGPPPPAVLAADATSTSSSMPMGGPGGASPASSSPTIHSCTSLSERGPAPAEAVSIRAEADGGATGGGAGASQQSHQHPTTPSKRRTVLNISPPPEDLFDDSRMSCQDELLPDSEQSSSIWMDDSASNFSIVSTSSYNDNTEVPRKSRKRGPRQRPGPKPAAAEEASMDVFDADSAKGPHFVLSQLGPDSKPVPKASSADNQQSVAQKGGTLSAQFPVKAEGKELKILVQPETQHRARYLTEGSRGSVKDRTQQGFPTVKLEGVNETVVLQVFVGNDTGRVKPHGFYQACRVTGRNTTACKEVDIDGTTVIEVCLDPSNNMTLAVDCVGILKLRNADVEARIGVAGSKKKSTRARLVFRVNIPRPDGSVLTLQAPSSPILCTQPAGVPEILKKSLHSCSAKGGEEVFLIGKNFLKGTKVIFQENASDESSWKAEAEIDMEFFHQNHLIVKVPPYQNPVITAPVSVGIYVVTNAGRSHDVQSFTYTPEAVKTGGDVPVKKETASPAKPCSFEEQIQAIQSGNCTLESTLMAPLMPLVKREEVMPMEVSSNAAADAVFKTAEAIGAAPQTMDLHSGVTPSSSPFPGTLPCPPGDPEQPQSAVFATPEPLTTIQKQDIAPASSFAVSVPQQFLLEASDRGGAAGGGPVVGLTQMEVQQQQQQSQQPQLTIFPQDGVAQLERAVRQLQAGGFSGAGTGTLVQQVLEAAVAQQQQQQLNSVLYSAASAAESMQQPQQVQENMGNMDDSLAKQQQQQVLENLQQQLQSELFQCTIFPGGAPPEAPDQHAPLFQTSQQQQQQQQAALFQQTGELLSIQTSSFLQQPPSHSPPNQQQQQLFHSPGPMTDSQFQQAPSGIFLSPVDAVQQQSPPSQQQQPPPPQQMDFLTSVEPAPSVFQQGTPMEQQGSGPTQQAGSLFQSMPPGGTLSPNRQPQQQPLPPAGLLYCSSSLSPQDQPPALLFSSQSMVAVSPHEPSEPMSFQEQSSIVGPTPGSEPPKPDLLGDQQLALFLPQGSIFSSQSGALQSSASSPVQQPDSLFQSQPGQTQQPGLFLFGIQNECGQLIDTQGTSLSDQLIAMSQSGQNQHDSDAQIQSLLDQSMEQSLAQAGSMTATQNMEKIDDLLVSLQEEGNNLNRSY